MKAGFNKLNTPGCANTASWVAVFLAFCAFCVVYAAAFYAKSSALLMLAGACVFYALNAVGLLPPTLIVFFLCSAAAFVCSVAKMPLYELFAIEAALLMQWFLMINANFRARRLVNLIEKFYIDVGESAQVSDVFNLAVRTIKEIGHYKLVGILTPEKQSGGSADLVVAACNYPEEVGTRFARDTGIVWQAYFEQKAVLVKDVSSNPYYVKITHKTTSEIAVPLKIGGRCFGVLNVESDKITRLTGKDSYFLSVMAIIISSCVLTLEQPLKNNK